MARDINYIRCYVPTELIKEFSEQIHNLCLIILNALNHEISKVLVLLMIEELLPKDLPNNKK